MHYANVKKVPWLSFVFSSSCSKMEPLTDVMLARQSADGTPNNGAVTFPIHLHKRHCFNSWLIQYNFGFLWKEGRSKIVLNHTDSDSGSDCFRLKSASNYFKKTTQYHFLSKGVVLFWIKGVPGTKTHGWS